MFTSSIKRVVLKSVSKNLTHRTTPFLTRIPQMGFSSESNTSKNIEVQKELSESEKAADEKRVKFGKRIVSIGDFLMFGAIGYLTYSLGEYLLDFPPVCQMAYQLAQESPFLQEHIGTPITRSLLWWGSVNDNHAKFSIDVTGPKGYARIDAKAMRGYNNEWEIVYLYGALPQFEMRLTDLLPPSETDNVMPYIPQHDDPSAAHALRGAPGLYPVAKVTSD